MPLKVIGRRPTQNYGRLRGTKTTEQINKSQKQICVCVCVCVCMCVLDSDIISTFDIILFPEIGEL